MPPTEPTDLYDDFAAEYHLLFEDWDASQVRQAERLQNIIHQYWPERTITGTEILDAACGIGTQALALAALGYKVTASDLSAGAVERAEREAKARSLSISHCVADMRELTAVHGTEQFDLVIACDNSVPHLLSDADILRAFRQFYACTRPGGGCLITVRDYAAEEQSGTHFKPMQTHKKADGSYTILFQIWDFQDEPGDGPIYDLALYLIQDDGNPSPQTKVFRSRYYAVTTDRLLSLMHKAGFADAIRVDKLFYQPVLVGHKSRA
jgi:SAM-dependent methyltransferase